jgi:alpha-1,6-mannosyltransferase
LFWRHLRGLGRMFDTVVCANVQLAERLRVGGVANSETVRMGVEAGLFSPSLRSPALREQLLDALGRDARATLFLGIGRFSAEKRWDMVLRAIGEAARQHEVGMVLVGDGPQRSKLEMLAERIEGAAVLPRIVERHEVARLVASADALVHGCEAETFCMVAAEARASGIPMIVPNRGAAIDQLVAGAGRTYRAANEISLERAMVRFIERGPELQRAVAARSSQARTMDEHFADLFARYDALGPKRRVQATGYDSISFGSVPEVVLARSGSLGS